MTQESSGGAKVLRDTTAKVTDVDAFGHVLTEEFSTAGVDLTFHGWLRSRSVVHHHL